MVAARRGHTLPVNTVSHPPCSLHCTAVVTPHHINDFKLCVEMFIIVVTCDGHTTPFHTIGSYSAVHRKKETALRTAKLFHDDHITISCVDHLEQIEAQIRL